MAGSKPSLRFIGALKFGRPHDYADNSAEPRPSISAVIACAGQTFACAYEAHATLFVTPIF